MQSLNRHSPTLPPRRQVGFQGSHGKGRAVGEGEQLWLASGMALWKEGAGTAPQLRWPPQEHPQQPCFLPQSCTMCPGKNSRWMFASPLREVLFPKCHGPQVLCPPLRTFSHPPPHPASELLSTQHRKQPAREMRVRPQEEAGHALESLEVSDLPQRPCYTCRGPDQAGSHPVQASLDPGTPLQARDEGLAATGMKAESHCPAALLLPMPPHFPPLFRSPAFPGDQQRSAGPQQSASLL